MGTIASVISVTRSYSSSAQHPTDTPGDESSHYLTYSIPEGSLFIRQGDYWIIRYQGHLAFLKSTRGLQCLALLLHHPGREFHARELLGLALGKPASLAKTEHLPDICRSTCDAGPILDHEAKAEYKKRLEELREDLKEAERFRNSDRVQEVSSQISSLAQQLASAIGLGGRDRKSGLEAERARSALPNESRTRLRKSEKLFLLFVVISQPRLRLDISVLIIQTGSNQSHGSFSHIAFRIL